MLLRSILAILAAFALAPSVAQAAESYDNCTGFIDSLPATVSTQGVWCLRRDLVATMANGKAITVAGNNVTIDCNGFRVANVGASADTTAYGIYAEDRANVAVRNCNVRGFWIGVRAIAAGGSQFVEGNRVQGSGYIGIWVEGEGSVVRNNLVSKTGDSGTSDLENAAIYARGPVDILDNVVAGVTGYRNQTGIATVQNIGGSVNRNRIRGVASTGGFAAMGIENDLGARMTIRDNDISAVGGLKGLVCSPKSLARGNIIVGFELGLVGCGDGGDNDVSP